MRELYRECKHGTELNEPCAACCELWSAAYLPTNSQRKEHYVLEIEDKNKRLETAVKNLKTKLNAIQRDRNQMLRSYVEIVDLGD